MRRTACILLALLAAKMAAAAPAELGRSELSALQPSSEVNQADGGESERSSRAVEHATNAKFGIKNFILDLIFGKINQAIDAKTRYVAQLDRLNIEKNRNLLNTDCENNAAGVGGSGGASASASFGGYPPSSSSSASGGASAGAVQGQSGLALGQGQPLSLGQGYPEQIPWASPSLGETAPYQSFGAW